MQALDAAGPNRVLALLNARNLDVVQLFCLLGVTVTLAAILHLDVHGLNWVLAHIE